MFEATLNPRANKNLYEGTAFWKSIQSKRRATSVTSYRLGTPRNPPMGGRSENLENPSKKAEISAPFFRLSLWLFLCCFWKVMKNVHSVGKGVVTLQISWKFVVELVWVLIICSLYNQELVHMGLIPEMMPSPNHVKFSVNVLNLPIFCISANLKWFTKHVKEGNADRWGLPRFQGWNWRFKMAQRQCLATCRIHERDMMHHE